MKTLFTKMKEQFSLNHLYTIIFLLLSNVIFAQNAGTLDKDFGINGIVTTSQLNAGLHSYCSLLQRDGKIILAGDRGVSMVEDSIYTGFVFIRYTSKGIIDSTFGNDGMVIVNFPDYFSERVYSIVEQPDGKIVACGDGYVGLFNANYNGLMVRLNSDGSLDPSFGDNGKLIYDSYRGQDHFLKLLLKENGKILACGTISFHAALIVQLLPNGTYDNSFGTNGVAQDEDINYNMADAVLQPDGKILTGGSYGFNPYQWQMSCARYLANGNLDSSFGNKGKVITNLPGSSEQILGIAIQQDGKIVGAGNSSGFDNIETIVRYTSQGVLDKSFGTNGVVYTNYPTGWASARDVMLQSDGKIITAVSNFDYDADYGYYAVNRYQTNGNLDSSFGNNGFAITQVGYNDYPTASLLQSDGKVLITGYTYILSAASFAIVRYLGDNVEKYVHIKHWLHRHGITWDDKPDNLSYYAVERSSNGNSFSEITRIFNRNNQTQFSYEDNAPLNGTNYYRLRTVSTDGAVAYSNVISISDEGSAIKVYPNPAQNNLQIEGLSATEKTKLTVLDFSGNIKATVVANNSSYNLNISHLKQGNYILRIETNDNVVTKKFVKE